MDTRTQAVVNELANQRNQASNAVGAAEFRIFR